MNVPAPDELERLRAAFSTAVDKESPGVDTLDADRIWQAVRGELSPDEVEKMADRAGRSPDTAAAWRLAVELSREIDGRPDDTAVGIGRRRPIRWAVGLAAAAVVVIGVGLPAFRSLLPKPPSALRATDHIEIGSELPAEEALARDSFELRWTPTGEDALYDIVVTDSDLAVLDRASFLEKATYTVPAEALSGVEEGAEVWWKIDATRSDGLRVSSPTFVQTVR